jgi:hypothetical protein
MAIDKAFEGESTVRMTLEGSNPAVLEGHPFRSRCDDPVQRARDRHRGTPRRGDGGHDRHRLAAAAILGERSPELDRFSPARFASVEEVSAR